MLVIVSSTPTFLTNLPIYYVKHDTECMIYANCKSEFFSVLKNKGQADPSVDNRWAVRG